MELKHHKAIDIAKEQLYELLQNSDIDKGHGYDHCCIVFEHACKILNDEHNILNDNRCAILLASLLHDADDDKFFTTTNNYNCKLILEKCLSSELVHIKDLVIEMINLVSCSKNGNTMITPEWKLIPRWADRLEAIGKIGIIRAIEYNHYTNRPVYIESTKLVTTEEELKDVADIERFKLYSTGQIKSVSLIDHFYDKIIHICDIPYDNPYIQTECKKRKKDVIEFILEFGKTQKIPEQYVEYL